MKRSVTTFIFLFFISTFLRAQSVDSMMQVYADQYPYQKVHVQFDKSVYRAGETVWFKAYLFEGYSRAIIGHNFYAEWIDADGNVKERKVYPIVDATAAGSFDIPENAPASVATIRAYTSWMLNFDTAFLYKKHLTILSQTGVAPRTTTADTARTSIHFFPEGGNLVEGVSSVVAFKANNSKGLPVAASGTIRDSKGNTVVSFRSEHHGMGKFTFTPAANETYTVSWTDHRDNQQQAVLPKALSEGIVMTTELIKDRLVFKITRSDNVNDDLKTLHVIAQLAQSPIYKSRINLESGFTTSGAIPIGKLPSGVLQLTLFSANWQPIAERIVLVNNNHHLFDATVSTPTLNTAKRAKNVVEIEVPDTLLTNMSIAITDAAIGNTPHEDNIVSRLLLTGDVKGYIHEPGYYFSTNSDTVKQHLDLVMLTHGWRRYKWDDLVKNKTPKLKYQPDTALTLQAKVFGLGNDTRIPDTEQLVAIVVGKDSSTQVLMLPKTSTNQFSMPLVFFDTVKVFYQFQQNRKLEKTASILVENNFLRRPFKANTASLPYIVPPLEVTNRTRQLATQLLRHGTDFNVKGNILAPVIVTTRTKTRIEQMDERYTFGMFKGADGQAFDMTDPMNASAFNIFAFLQGRVAGIQIQDPFNNPSVTWRREPVALFLDQMPVDAQTLATINVNDVAYIKTFRPPFFGAFGGGSGGAIAVYTKRGNDRPMELGAGLSRAKVAGYSELKEFYSPDYSKRNSEKDVVADYRTTLYWHPYIFTDGSNNTVRVEFFNNDISTSFRIVLEGVNEVGKMTRVEKIVQQ
ncbi:MG2 domain-containing protein [Aridibaculum aurantiacum]|uniref:MG2 domain-containing protein n=1 Tax=Aridibaculum aurantiacum TaxID=2810307 RepID=UPI001A95F63A|nr:MG2 domain-containing protein [Aridibaculum aurantiacum]